jgi:hypothetical protein
MGVRFTLKDVWDDLTTEQQEQILQKISILVFGCPVQFRAALEAQIDALYSC